MVVEYQSTLPCSKKVVRTQKGNLLHTIRNEKGQRGVGFLIRSNLINKVKEVRGVTDRIALLKLEKKRQ